eukprot:CAMPEP_0201489842 /NCGR_PEP_ID=MMETSP0151_2-20130828/23916_1 /ASSEMBLY_ACC=CAM_ASM_000257 /TAXON_ID=200890 /ORGANISM="Paramoeba atlantica, Strain 621/1 / CCAP 1560/9" /LENGTH=193 /DNA_ID=CAMNT_0047875557 /DNA_START=132 /DNA_END=714 /DNA_ORIENTATION=+
MRVNRWSPSEARQTKIVIVSGDDEMEDGGAFENNIPSPDQLALERGNVLNTEQLDQAQESLRIKLQTKLQKPTHQLVHRNRSSPNNYNSNNFNFNSNSNNNNNNNNSNNYHLFNLNKPFLYNPIFNLLRILFHLNRLLLHFLFFQTKKKFKKEMQLGWDHILEEKFRMEVESFSSVVACESTEVYLIRPESRD